MELRGLLHEGVGRLKKQMRSGSDQMSLGGLHEKLLDISKRHKSKKEQPDVVFDFCQLFPVKAVSYRGDYSELSFCYTDWDKGEKPMKLNDFADLVGECIGKTFTGYKGGSFLMGNETPVWVANWGDSGSTAVVDVLDMEYKIVLVTGYRE